MVRKVGFEPTPFQSARFTVWCSSTITAASPISIEFSVFNVGQLYHHDFHLCFALSSKHNGIIQEKNINAIG